MKSCTNPLKRKNMNPIPVEKLLEAAIEIAHTAGEYALSGKNRRREVAQTIGKDIKLVMDSETQRVAEKTLFSIYPGHAVLGEEGSTPRSDAAYEWIIDPIDGTLNYTNDLTYWCTSVAVRRDGKTLAGCVYAPELDESYSASVDSPARCNGETIHPSKKTDFSDAMIFSGLTKNLNPGDPVLQLFAELSCRARKVRIYGSAALDICGVARGRGDAFLETDIFIWDTAAAALIAEQAGARTEVLKQHDETGQVFLCSNGPMHEPVSEIYRTVYS